LGAVLLSLALPASAVPVSCFVVHAEPTGVNAATFQSLAALVATADRCGVPLTLLLTAQWAEFILADPERVDAIETWIAAGHEVGAHHHAYWATQGRAAVWDGYTNVPLADLMPSDRRALRGTMDAFWSLLAALPGERRTACLGLGADDAADWLCTVPYSISGHALADAVSLPTPIVVNGCAAVEVCHALLSPTTHAALATALAAADDDAVFAVVLHVTDFADRPATVTDWFAVLAAHDPEGARRMTVSGALSSWPLP